MKRPSPSLLPLILFGALTMGAAPDKPAPGDPPEGEDDAPTSPSTEPPPGTAETSSSKAQPEPEIQEPAVTKPGEATAADVQPEAEDFFQFSDFVDTRVTFAISNVNLFAGPGERVTETSGYRIGVDRNFNLFIENVNTRFSGYESLSHLVLHKKMPGFFENWETEAALAALVLANFDTGATSSGALRPGQLSLFDSGSYLRIARKFGPGSESEEGSFDVTAFPVSADRFRLGYTYLISWGGTVVFPGRGSSRSITEGAVPGLRFRVRGPKGQSYAFLGFKSALIESKQAGVEAGEKVPNYGVLAGGGIDVANALLLEVNGGFFQKGTQVRPGLEGKRINAYGVSSRITYYEGEKPRASMDYQLYRNDPTAPVDYLLFKEYKPGTSYSFALEGNLLAQNLEDPDRFASEKMVPAVAAGLVGILKLDYFLLRLDAFYQSVDFILFNVPGFVPFQAIPAGASTTPEFFAGATFQYALEDIHFRPSLGLGVKIPATYRGVTLSDQGGSVGGARPGELRTQVIVDDTFRVVLPPGTGATPTLGAVLKAPLALSKSTVVAGELRFELNDNQPRLAQDNERGEVTYKFDSPARLSFALVLQSRW